MTPRVVLQEVAERPGKAILRYDQNRTDCIRVLSQDKPDTLAPRNYVAQQAELARAHLLYGERLRRENRRARALVRLAEVLLNSTSQSRSAMPGGIWYRTSAGHESE